MGIRGYAAVGVHPRAIPRRGLSDVLASLPEMFSGGRVVALGEIGFHRGGPDEEEALVEQLGLARRLGLRVVLHTPALDKERWTRRLLALVQEHGPLPARVLVDHASARTVPLILARGHWAGLTVQVGELTADRTVQLVRRLGSRRLLLGSDAGDRPGDLLGLPRAVHLLERARTRRVPGRAGGARKRAALPRRGVRRPRGFRQYTATVSDVAGAAGDGQAALLRGPQAPRCRC